MTEKNKIKIIIILKKLIEKLLIENNLNQKINLLLIELNEQLNFIDLEIDDEVKKCEKAIEISVKAKDNLKALIQKTTFKSQEEEIQFFKEIKPQFTSKIIYYNSIFKIAMKKPSGGARILKKYYKNELIRLKYFFDNELEFYQYQRSGNNYLDHKYFLRGKFDMKLSLDSHYFELDINFSTSHDFKMARLIANGLIELYIENKLQGINNVDGKEKSQRQPNTKMTWTGSKVALTELLYALHSEGVLNNGAADLKDIAAYFEYIFEIDLGQYRRTFLEIRMRKTEKTKFIAGLNDALLRRMENTDETI